MLILFICLSDTFDGGNRNENIYSYKFTNVATLFLVYYWWLAFFVDSHFICVICFYSIWWGLGSLLAHNCYTNALYFFVCKITMIRSVSLHSDKATIFCAVATRHPDKRSRTLRHVVVEFLSSSMWSSTGGLVSCRSPRSSSLSFHDLFAAIYSYGTAQVWSPSTLVSAENAVCLFS